MDQPMPPLDDTPRTLLPEEPMDGVPAEPKGPRPATALAWIVIVLSVIGTLVLGQLGASMAGGGKDVVGMTLMKAQCKYLIGASALTPGSEGLLLAQSRETLDIGSIEQRLAFVVVSSEMIGTVEASDTLAMLEADIASPPVGPAPELTETQTALLDALRKLYAADPSEADGEVEVMNEARLARLASLTDEERELIRTELEWFGDLAVNPRGIDDQTERSDILASARFVAVALIGLVVAGIVAGVIGLLLLVLLMVFFAIGKAKSNLGTGKVPHGLYAETFAVWMILFFALQIAGGYAGAMVPDAALLITLVAFFGSLAALAWPVMRGASWSDVRRDVGLTIGPAPIAEPFVGVGGYLMALPVLGIGVVLTYCLMILQSVFSGPVPTFSPSGGPAHPIIAELGGDNWAIKLQVLAIAAIAAPVVEETMFRGALYRHLRDAWGNMGIVLSVILSATLSSFIFAIIHPQGWVAVPALMSLAYVFVLMREWRGTLIPAMVVHGISNGLIMGVVIVLLGA